MLSRSIDIDGPVHYADFGGEGPAVVLVHGLGGSHLNWMRAGPLLARRARVFAPDLAGFGRTPLAGRRPTVGDNRRLVSRFIQHVVGGPAVVVGNSMGGAIALSLAADEPASVAGVVLVDPALPRRLRAGVDRTVAARFAAGAIPGIGETLLRRRAESLGPEGVVRETFALCFADGATIPDDVFSAHVGMATERREMPWSQSALLQGARSVLATVSRRRTFFAMARRVTAPVLLVHGAQDRLVPVRSARTLAADRVDWTFEIFEGVGHVPPLEAPERLVGSIEAWLDGTGAAAAMTATAMPRHSELL